MASCITCGAMRHTSGKGEVLREVAAGRQAKYLHCGLHGKYKGFKPTSQDIATWPEGHKRCTDCREIKPFKDFHRHATAMFGYNTVCKECRTPITRQAWIDKSYVSKMFDRAKTRSTMHNREFSITIDDVVVPDVCPVFKIPFEYTPGSLYVPSIDRIDSSKGYIPGNVQVISWRANSLKNNMTADEARLLAEFMVK